MDECEEHALVVRHMFYNFGIIHESLRVTLTMEAGIADPM
jgi:hypothetical protein